MKLLLLAACDICLLDQRTNSVSAISFIEEFPSPAFPVLLPRLSIVALFEKEGEEPDIIENVTLTLGIGEQVLFTSPLQVDFQGKRRLRNLTEIGGLVIPTSGTLKIMFAQGNEELGSWNIPVTRIRPPEASVVVAAASGENEKSA